MSKLNITVDGRTYEVEVEEVGASSVAAPVRQAPATAAPRAEVRKPSAPKVAGGGSVTAPMPGTIIDIKVTEGQAVKAGDVLLILEAMKMENEIVAPQDGKVAKISTSKGAKVASGDMLVTLG